MSMKTPRKKNDGAVPESVILESLQFHQQPWLTIPEMQVTQVPPSFPDSIAVFPASLFDSTFEVITGGPPHLPLMQEKVIPETQAADCQSSSKDITDELLERVKVIVKS
jgi:hypothetical protein